jgi:hypothetical protein
MILIGAGQSWRSASTSSQPGLLLAVKRPSRRIQPAEPGLPVPDAERS